MTDQDSAAKQTVTQALLASGFPFQTSIARLVRSVPGCESVKEEFPWQDDEDRFFALIAFIHNFIVVVECKKTQKEIFTFLQPQLTQDLVIRSRCAHLFRSSEQAGIRSSFSYAEWFLMPRSHESAFCVVSTSESGKDQRLLERDAQLLVRGIDSTGTRMMHDRKVGFGARVFVPIIVTNAKLFVARYDPEAVSLDTGQIPMTPAPELFPIEWVRFRKAFTATYDPGLGDRTVFVVSANSLHKFLSALQWVDVGYGKQRQDELEIHSVYLNPS